VILLKKENSIIKIARSGLCVGCGMCIAVCPNNAIELMIDGRKGIYLPIISTQKCNDCGACVKSCPGMGIDFKKYNLNIFGEFPDDLLLGNHIKSYSGFACDKTVRINSSSGGLITALLIHALEHNLIDGALVTRMKRESPLEPESFIARTPKEIIDSSKSKYCPVPFNAGIREILNSEKDERFAVVGLPCHIHGIRKLEDQSKIVRNKIPFHLGLFCTHTPTFAGTEFLLDKILTLKKSDIKNMHYRGSGWPGLMKIQTKNDRTIEFQYSGIWDKELVSVGNIVMSFIHPRCCQCIDGSNELADISFADAWNDKYRNDVLGRSFIISRNKIGQDILRSAAESGKIEINEIDSKEIKESQKMLEFKKRRFHSLRRLYKTIGKSYPEYNYEFKISDPRSLYRSVLFEHMWRNIVRYHPSLWSFHKLYLFKKLNYSAQELSHLRKQATQQQTETVLRTQ